MTLTLITDLVQWAAIFVIMWRMRQIDRKAGICPHCKRLHSTVSTILGINQ